MHRRLLLLVVAALLLRGWIGEAMAGQMLAQQLQAPTAVVHAMPVHGPDCQGMAAGEDGASGDASSMVHCQDCTLNALPAATMPMAQPPHADTAPGPLPRFASAESQPRHRPPIS